MNEQDEQLGEGQVDGSSSVTRHRRRDASQWRALIERHRESGLSVRAFCRQQALNEASFHGWRRRLRDRALPTPHASTPHASTPFVRLQPRERPEGGVLRVRFACGATLRCSSACLPELVRLLKGGIGSC